MELKYNEIIGAIVKPDDTVATQAEILEWAAENPMPIEEPKKQNTALLEEVIETFKKRGQTNPMAEIDKSLPNQKTTVEVPGEVEIQEAIKEIKEQG